MRLTGVPESDTPSETSPGDMTASEVPPETSFSSSRVISRISKSHVIVVLLNRREHAVVGDVRCSPGKRTTFTLPWATMAVLKPEAINTELRLLPGLRFALDAMTNLRS